MGYDMRHRKAGDGDYFRLNIWGMGAYRQHMLETGMAFDQEARYPEWPELPDGVDWDDVYAYRDRDDSYYDDIRAKWAADMPARIGPFVEAYGKVLAWHGEETPGIPLHKFCSNDGWIVTPVECQAAVALWRRNGSKPYGDTAEARDYWHKWIAFLESAVERDGFEVH